MGFQPQWTPEEDQQLRELVAQVPAISYRVIGAQLGKGKNACIGRARRIGIPQRNFFSGKGRKKVPRTYGPRAATRRHAPPKPVPAPEPTPRPTPPGGKTLLDLGPDDCRWLFDSGMYCGAQAQPRQSYCAACARIAYQPARPRRAA